MSTKPEVIHTFPFEVLYQHLDIFGHVNNASYLNILEEARWDLIESGGYGINTILERQEGPTILEIQIRFKAEMKFKEKAKVLTYKPKFTHKKIMLLEQQILNSKMELCCQAQFTFGFFDMKKRKLIEPPELWLRAVKAN
jgi:acyl-CoA thioester hydrolase